MQQPVDPVPIEVGRPKFIAFLAIGQAIACIMLAIGQWLVRGNSDADSAWAHRCWCPPCASPIPAATQRVR